MSEFEPENQETAANLPIYKVFVGGLSVNCEDRELREYLQQFGEVIDCEIIRDKQGKSKGYCFATYLDRAGQLRAIGRHHILQGKVFEIREQLDSDKNSELLSEIAKRKVFVSNLKANIDEDDLEKFFSRFGAIEEVLISRDPATQQSKGFGFVKFYEECSTREALLGQERRNIKIKNQEVTIKQCIPKPQMTKLKKNQKPEDALSFYRSTDYEDGSEIFSLYGSPIMGPSIPYNHLIQNGNYMMSPSFGGVPSHQLMMCNPNYPVQMVSAHPYSPEHVHQEEKKSPNKHLNVRSTSFNIPAQELVLPLDNNKSPVMQANAEERKISAKPNPSITPLTLDFTGLELPPLNTQDKEERIRRIMEAETAANSLAGSFATQDSTGVQGSPVQSLTTKHCEDSLVCKCGEYLEGLHNCANKLDSFKRSACLFGSFGFDQILEDAGLLTKLSTSNRKASIEVDRRTSFNHQETSPYRPLHGFPVSSNKYKLSMSDSRENKKQNLASMPDINPWNSDQYASLAQQDCLHKAFF